MPKRVLATILLATIILGADIGNAANSGNIVVMPVETAEKSPGEGGALMTEIISAYFKNNQAVTIISTEQKEALAGADTGNRLQLLQNIAAKMASEQALLFTLTRYRERVGDKYSVEDPASLAFEFKLINAADGKVTCSGRFDETQQALTENILNIAQSFRRGFKWLTIAEMASEAIPSKFAACPALAAKPGP